MSPVPTIPPVATPNIEATLEALDYLCDEFESDSSRHSEISPDAKWFATRCGYERNQMLIVQNQEGLRWVFNFADFISPDIAGIMGGFVPLAWSVDDDGVRITNLINDEVTILNNTDVMEMSWSPDGRFLAFSVASCGEDFVESSTIYAWDSLNNETQVLFSTEEMLLMPRTWIGNLTLRFEGKKWTGKDYLYTFYDTKLVHLAWPTQCAKPYSNMILWEMEWYSLALLHHIHEFILLVNHNLRCSW